MTTINPPVLSDAQNNEASSPTQSAATAEVDHALASLLARLSALQGLATPVHRFAMMHTSAGGAELASLDRVSRAQEWWLSALPGSEVIPLKAAPGRDDLPALWIAHDGTEAYLLRGALSNGSFTAEAADGSNLEIDSNRLSQGQTLLMTTTPVDEALKGEKPRTARDWFFYAIRKRMRVFIEAVFASGLTSMLALAASMYTMQVYDRVVPSQGYSTLIVLTVGAAMALLLELLVKHVRARMLDRICKKIDEELSGVFFARVLSIRMDARPKTIGTFASQVKQFEMVRNFMTSSTLFVLADMPFVIFFIVVIGMVGGWVAAVPLALVPLSLAVGFYAQWKMSNAAEEQIKSSNYKNGVLIEAIDGIEGIKAAGGEWKLQDRWSKLTSEAAEHELAIRSTTATANHLAQTIQQFSFILMIGLGAYFVTTGQLTQGALIACSIISNRALGPIAQIAGLVLQWQHARAALRGLDEMMELPCDQMPGEERIIPADCTGELSLDAATFSYSKDLEAVKPTSLLIRPGERIAILGPVGSGKSTLIKLLSGLYKPTEGRVFMDGVDMAHLAPDFVREHVGYLTQDVRLFSGSLKDNLTIGLPSPSDAQVLAAAQKTGLDRFVRDHPAGFGLPIMEGGRGLSGGQRQLVGLTRLLLARPNVLLLDEPTASMDGDLELHVMKNLFANAASKSVIVMATHKRSLVNLVSRVIVMDRGRIVLDGPRDEVMARLLAGAQQQRSNPRPQEAVA